MGVVKVIVVTPDGSKEFQERVYRLRYQIYVEELGHKLENDERMLHDKYDGYSTSFLLEIDGNDVGTTRFTAKRDGRLESEDQHESWRLFISSSEKNSDIVAELTRFMLRRDYRGTRASLRLGDAAFQHCIRVGTFKVYLFAKAGGVAALAKKLGFRECIHEKLPFILNNYSLGPYLLMRADFGSPWSLRRAWIRSRRALLKALGDTSFPIQKALLRRGNGYAP
jgi:hypothetical protein